MHVNSFWFQKFFAIEALMFTDDMVPIPFQVNFTLILTTGLKKGLNCSGVIYFWCIMRGIRARGVKNTW